MNDGGHVWWETRSSTRCTRAASPTRTVTAWATCRDCGPAWGTWPTSAWTPFWLTPFYPSPLADGGYDVSDYCAVDPLLGTMTDFDHLVKDAAAYQIRVIVDLVPNHCSSAHPLFRTALAAAPGSPSGPGSSSATGAAPAASCRRTTGSRSSAAPPGPG